MGGTGGTGGATPYFLLCLLKLRIERFGKLLQERLTGPLSGRAESGQRPLGGSWHRHMSKVSWRLLLCNNASMHNEPIIPEVQRFLSLAGLC